MKNGCFLGSNYIWGQISLILWQICYFILTTFAQVKIFQTPTVISVQKNVEVELNNYNCQRHSKIVKMCGIDRRWVKWSDHTSNFIHALPLIFYLCFPYESTLSCLQASALNNLLSRGCSRWRSSWRLEYYNDQRCANGWTHNGNQNCSIRK